MENELANFEIDRISSFRVTVVTNFENLVFTKTRISSNNGLSI